MEEYATLNFDDRSIALPIVTGTEGERAIDISSLRAESGLTTLDEGLGNTASCRSAITYIDGEQGILRYRGIPIEQLAEKSSFIEVAELLIFGGLPSPEERQEFRTLLEENSALHRDMRKLFDGFPSDAHPMAMLSAVINGLQAYDLPQISIDDEESFRHAAAVLISKVRTIAAASYKSHLGQPLVYPRFDLSYAENLLHMMFTQPYKEYEPTPEVAHALNMFLVLHADHEQNCSTSTVRMVASGGANLYAAVSAGVCALWGDRHGGANMAVIQMLERIREQDMPVKTYLEQVKRKGSGKRLMGFGHRVYRNFDPRALVLKNAADGLLDAMCIDDPLLDIARELETAALEDDYFAERKLYPNVDFYSGIILRAIGIPLDMFTVMFAIGRTPGWIAHWKEISDAERKRIYRPRQIYVGEGKTDWQPKSERKSRFGWFPGRRKN
ncbi:citrate synthase [uncultured Tessaracoccus sp.]|uniref:citrate synthase n=1 Tax=uncultured Tessaracoccus sp. TaxID=905023 RepID=UPI00261E2030|nr:citrate synthase [uncultured Tessaracoccus sp.]